MNPNFLEIKNATFVASEKNKINKEEYEILRENYKKNTNFISSFRIFGNFVLTKISNLINNQNLTDAHTCYKVFTKNVFDNIVLKEEGFNFCPEITTKIANLGERIEEVPIDYNGRSKNEGKKITWRDGFSAIRCILKYNLFR